MKIHMPGLAGCLQIFSAAKRTISTALLTTARWRVRTPIFILIAALFNAVVYNIPLYLFGIDNLDITSFSAVATLLTLFILVVALTALFLGIASLISQRLIKPLLMIIAIANAFAVYFMVTYRVVLDKTMMGNAFNTDIAEASTLFHPWLLVYVLLLGIVPCWLIAKVKIQPIAFLWRLLFPVVVCIVTVGWVYGASQSWLWIDKHAKLIGGMVMPWSYVINGARYLESTVAPPERKLLPAASFLSEDKKVVFLMIGESSRAQNSSSYGYGRPTNPEVTKAGVTVLNKTHSCATYTTASLECILAYQDPGSRPAWEPLTSYLQHQGVEVTWRTNNSGEPPMKVHAYERLAELKAECTGEECNQDGGLLRGIEQRINDSKQQRILVVFHLGGSHGPAYNTRYPPRFERFKPVCTSVQLSQCTSEELINAYDNTLVYTDYVVSEAIGILKRLKGYSTSLIYISDHGESLGEYNLYLHGTPWSIAPDVQKEVPFFMWDSAISTPQSGTTPLTVEGEFSQANVFHSVMGAFGMRSDIYDKKLDLFTKVRGK